MMMRSYLCVGHTICCMTTFVHLRISLKIYAVTMFGNSQLIFPNSTLKKNINNHLKSNVFVKHLRLLHSTFTYRDFRKFLEKFRQLLSNFVHSALPKLSQSDIYCACREAQLFHVWHLPAFLAFWIRFAFTQKALWQIDCSFQSPTESKRYALLCGFQSSDFK